MIPRLISGWPKVADSAAMRKSQAIASSQPPPNAIALTAAIVTVRELLHRPRMKRVRLLEQRRGPRPPRPSCVNSLMSAPAQNVNGFDEAITSARALPSTSSQSSVSSRDHLRRERVGRRAVQPRDRRRRRASRAARSRAARPRRAAGRGRSPGPSSCRAGPGRPGGAGSAAARSARPTPPARARAPRAISSSPCSSARANGPGMMPAPIIMPMSMSLMRGDALLEHEAGLDERLQREALDERAGRSAQLPCS